MLHQLIDSVPWWAVLIGTIVILLGASEVGFYLGRRTSGAYGESRNRDAGIGAAAGAILGLLGLMLAFSFSVVETRFAARKTLVLDEANAIGTTYLRAAMLPAPHGARIQSLLREYVGVRLEAIDPSALYEVLLRSEELQHALWGEAVAVAIREPESEVVGRFIESLNQVIDLHEARVTVSLYQRLPHAILVTLYLVSVLAIMILGYAGGLGRWHSLLPTFVSALAVSSVIVLIVELDRPGARLVRVNQSALVDLRETLEDPRHQAQPATTTQSRR